MNLNKKTKTELISIINDLLKETKQNEKDIQTLTDYNIELLNKNEELKTYKEKQQKLMDDCNHLIKTTKKLYKENNRLTIALCVTYTVAIIIWLLVLIQ